MECPNGDTMRGRDADREDPHVPPLPARWQGRREGNKGSLPGGSPSVMPTEVCKGFDEEIEVFLLARESNFIVHVGSRELAASRGVVLALHGGGFTGMSWAPVAGILKQHCCVLAPDLRGHGLTSSADDDSLSLESLTEDIMGLLVEIVKSEILFVPESTPSSSCSLQPPDKGGEISSPRESVPTSGSKQGQGETERTIERLHPQGVDHACTSIVNHRGVADSEAGSCAAANGPVRITGPGAVRGQEVAEDDKVDVVDSSSATSKVSSGTDGYSSAGSGKHSSSRNLQQRESVQRGSGGNACLKLLLVGHSLGGSIAVRVAEAGADLKRQCGGRIEIGGVVAVDVVEGTALATLEDMPQILSKIPKRFANKEEAVLWHLTTGAVRNVVSASTVVPSRLKQEDAGDGVVWRTDLQATERHWRGWFEGLSEAFLALPVPKLLMVAGMDRLDTLLTGAYMQGKFQLKLVYGCGHSIQEDQPHETAATIMSFALRNSILRRGASGAVAATKGVLSDEDELKRKLARARRT